MRRIDIPFAVIADIGAPLISTNPLFWVVSVCLRFLVDSHRVGEKQIIQ